MSSVPAPIEPRFPATRARALRPLPLLTAINYFNYLDPSVPIGLQVTAVAFFSSGALFMLVARRQRYASRTP